MGGVIKMVSIASLCSKCEKKTGSYSGFYICNGTSLMVAVIEECDRFKEMK